MRGVRRLLLLAALALLAVAGCRKECEQNLNCPTGQVCSDGQCVARVCADSTVCPMEHYCNDDSGTCVAGCQSDRDCYPYHRCNESGQCVESGCRSTVLDCAFGQYCNDLTGECYDAGGAYCHTCEVDADCGGSNICYSAFSPNGQGYCLVDCSMGQECPRGYTCTTFVYPGGAVAGDFCYARCWEL